MSCRSWLFAGHGRNRRPAVGAGRAAVWAVAVAPQGSLGVHPRTDSWGQRVRDRAARIISLVHDRFLDRNVPSPVVRSAVVCARETIALVLDEEAPVPETQRDVQDLRLRLRGHLMQLGARGPRTGPWAQALDEARQLAEQAPPLDDFLGSRVHLRQLALRVRALLAEMGDPEPVPELLGSGQEAAASTPTPLDSLFGATAARWRQ
ncbi:DUF6415 family natural product biosynthesis protein [Streptomyces sp. NPDC058770]|uniref:DUF6415 family natural product biosynthesis protein n=1 Tax=Streptomyces sp. NPDC058770 TaxID=3346631 RepID=UPI0036AD120E